MVRALVGCLHCGYIARRNSLVRNGGRCPECETELRPVSLPQAQMLAKRRRANDAQHAGVLLATKIASDPSGTDMVA